MSEELVLRFGVLGYGVMVLVLVFGIGTGTGGCCLNCTRVTLKVR